MVSRMHPVRSRVLAVVKLNTCFYIDTQEFQQPASFQFLLSDAWAGAMGTNENSASISDPGKTDHLFPCDYQNCILAVRAGPWSFYGTS